MLVRSDARGFATHGLTRLQSYVEKLGTGEMTAAARPEEEWQGTFGRIRAHGALGQIAGPFAIDRAVAATADEPFAILRIEDTGHLGALGLHVLRAAEAGRVALLLQPTPPVVALPGAKGPMLGNSPLAMAAPRPNGPPVVVDIACSVAARGNILLAARAGRPIPAGWAVAEAGAPTTDAEAALRGALLPFGGTKGMMLSVIVEVLAGSLSGRAFESALNRPGEVRHGVGHLSALLLVANPTLLAGAAYGEHMRQWTEHYKAAGGRLARIPGERAAAAEAAAEALGAPLDGSVIAELVALGVRLGLSFPQLIGG
ncbi:MAG: Ldh family oxidoreductase [Alphaproteobacteria bacterium]|nr:Ldh family oxidoreductase [Alphaproteobacteria bacterium]